MRVRHCYTNATITICKKHYRDDAVPYLGPIEDSRGQRCSEDCAAREDARSTDDSEHYPEYDSLDAEG